MSGTLTALSLEIKITIESFFNTSQLIISKFRRAREALKENASGSSSALFSLSAGLPTRKDKKAINACAMMAL